MAKATFLLSWALVFGLLAAPALHAAESKGRIEGRVARADGSPLPGVGVALEGTSLVDVSDGNGRFRFAGVPADTYSLIFTLLDYSASRPDVVVTAGASTVVEQVVDWEVGLVETVTVRSASRRRERIVDAPASVTTVGEQEIARQAAHGQGPKLFEFTPGVDITQTNVADFLISTRGFNSGLNRRVAVLVDGRDTTDPFVGAPEWGTIAFPLDDLAEAELLRGPTAALYGANATTGIVTLTSSEPRYTQGGRLRLAPGERSTLNADFRWAGSLGSDWHLKVLGASRSTDGFSVSRRETVEYSAPCDAGADPPIITNCLPLDSPAADYEQVVDIRSGGVRLDRYLGNGSLFTVEGGTAEYEGTVFVSAVGRGQIRKVKRPWARAGYSAERWNLFAYYNKRDAEAQNLTSGRPFTTVSDNIKLEFQTNWDFLDERIRLVAGASHMGEEIDSNAQERPVDVDEQALFAQVDWEVSERLKLVGALRWDDSTLHDSRVSPKGSIVYRIDPNHSLRFTYNEAFQVPTIADLYLYFDLPGGTDFSAENEICLDQAGVDCGLSDSTTTLILGNESLDVEEVTTYEIGYKGILGRKAFLTIDVYDSRNQNFVQGGLFQVGPDGELTNPNFGPWVGPSEAETTTVDPGDIPEGCTSGMTVADCVRARAESALITPDEGGALLTNREGESIVLFQSSTTFGKVDTRGVDVGFGYFFSDDLRLDFSYSWFDFGIAEDRGGQRDLLLPNAPENKASAGLTYTGDRWDASLRGRWVDSFFWFHASWFNGDVESYTTVDLSGNYRLNQHWTVGLHVANLFDDKHWEAWGADLLRRRALAHATFNW